MNQRSHATDWLNLLADCIAGACAGLLIGLLLPVGRAIENIIHSLEFGPGQSASSEEVLVFYVGWCFFFTKSGTIEYETYRGWSINDHTVAILNGILIATVLVQVVLTKIWTS
jgi:hypothetical protein